VMGHFPSSTFVAGGDRCSRNQSPRRVAMASASHYRPWVSFVGGVGSQTVSRVAASGAGATAGGASVGISQRPFTRSNANIVAASRKGLSETG
jgi:hypothetical protein